MIASQSLCVQSQSCYAAGGGSDRFRNQVPVPDSV